jgi:hypothetical protein
MWEAVFWTSAALILYTYAGYPLISWALAAWRPVRPARDEENLPDVAFVVSAYN